MKYHFTFIRWVRTEYLITSNVGENMNLWKFSDATDGSVNCYNYFGKQHINLYSLNICLCSYATPMTQQFHLEQDSLEQQF